jgi:GMP synthase (glutamine-hydrolysing)
MTRQETFVSSKTSSHLGAGKPRVLVIQPDQACPLDRFGRWLSEDGFIIRMVRPFDHDIVPDTVEEDALVVLGGDMSSMDDHLYDWLARIRKLFVDAADRGKPALGICLGAQLMAQAFGGTIARGRQGLEAGVVRVSWRPEALGDSLVGDLPDPFLVGAMHGDMIETLPPAAVWLGTTRLYPHQAFRVGETSWGVQFHPELSPAGYRSWLALVDEDDTVAVERSAQGMTGFEQHDQEVAAHTERLARRFAAHVRSASSVS